MLSQMFEGTGLSEVLAQNPPLAFVTLFGAGLVTSLTPCVYPMIPITASVLAGSAEHGAPRSRVVGLTFTYALGLALLYATLGLVAGPDREPIRHGQREPMDPIGDRKSAPGVRAGDVRRHSGARAATPPSVGRDRARWVLPVGVRPRSRGEVDSVGSF